MLDNWDKVYPDVKNMSLTKLLDSLFEGEVETPIWLSGLDLIGYDFIGIKFSDEEYCRPGWGVGMEYKIGIMGEIIDVVPSGYRVQFEDGIRWVYPKKLVENQINGI